MPEKPFNRVLLIRGGALGDFLLTLPALHALRQAAQTVELLAYPPFAALAREARLADGVRSIEYAPLAGFFARGASLNSELQNYFSSFDAVLSYLFDPDGIFAENLRFAGVKNFIQGPHKPDESRHATDQLSAPLQQLGLRPLERAILLHFSAPPPKVPLLAIHPGSGSLAKNWPPPQWKYLAESLLEAHPDLHLAILGGEADGAALEALGDLRKNPRVEFLENLPLTTLAQRLAGASAFLGHDTGVSHLAAALGLPSLLLFGPTNPAIWAPPYPQTTVLRAPDGNLSSLRVSTVRAAVEILLAPTLAPEQLASTQPSQHNPPP